MRIAVLVIGLCVAGCAGRPAEIAWQTLNAVDALQTLEIARDDCYVERNGITRRLIGDRPNEAGVLAWWAATSAGHAWVSSKLEGRALVAWQAVTIAASAITVIDNRSIGLRIGGPNVTADSGGWCSGPEQSAHPTTPAFPWK